MGRKAAARDTPLDGRGEAGEGDGAGGVFRQGLGLLLKGGGAVFGFQRAAVVGAEFFG